MNVNINLMIENESKIRNGLKLNGDVSVKIQKSIICFKKAILGILLNVFVKMVNIKQEL